jgi:hypothetical protein
MPPLEVIENDPIRDGDKRLVGTLPTLDARLLADAAYPLVPARGSVSFAPGGGVGPKPRVDIVSAPEELTEERHLLVGSVGSGRIWEEGKQPAGGGGLQSGQRQVASETFQPILCPSALVFQAREPSFLAGDRLPELC